MGMAPGCALSRHYARPLTLVSLRLENPIGCGQSALRTDSVDQVYTFIDHFCGSAYEQSVMLFDHGIEKTQSSVSATRLWHAVL